MIQHALRWLGCCLVAGALMGLLPSHRGEASAWVVLLGVVGSDAGARPTPSGNPPVRAQSGTQRAIK
ncbi:hypothetical protein HDG38_006934 [Paraburkholderia sp. WSM4177]|nr:hypothetical protein [Paraburkholderia sp. WSM4177]MBB5488668.1 hypothetical protein [Paraburkholderia sp. WSM4180]